MALFESTRQRPTSARPRLQQAPVSFALPAEKRQHDACASPTPPLSAPTPPVPFEVVASLNEAQEGGPGVSTGSGFLPQNDTLEHRNATVWSAQQQRDCNDVQGTQKYISPLVRRATNAAPNANWRSAGSTKVWQQAAYVPYSRKNEEFSTYGVMGGGVEVITPRLDHPVGPRSPNGPLDPAASEAIRIGRVNSSGNDPVQVYRNAVRHIEFGNVARLVRGPLHIPVRRRSSVGVPDGLFFDDMDFADNFQAANVRAPSAHKRPSFPRETLIRQRGGVGGGRRGGSRRPMSAGHLRYGVGVLEIGSVLAGDKHGGREESGGRGMGGGRSVGMRTSSAHTHTHTHPNAHSGVRRRVGYTDNQFQTAIEGARWGQDTGIPPTADLSRNSPITRVNPAFNALGLHVACDPCLATSAIHTCDTTISRAEPTSLRTESPRVDGGVGDAVGTPLEVRAVTEVQQVQPAIDAAIGAAMTQAFDALALKQHAAHTRDKLLQSLADDMAHRERLLAAREAEFALRADTRRSRGATPRDSPRGRVQSVFAPDVPEGGAVFPRNSPLHSPVAGHQKTNPRMPTHLTIATSPGERGGGGGGLSGGRPLSKVCLPLNML